VPAISNMCLEIGAICYPAAPFNGWYMGTEIGARNFGDSGRYDQLPLIAERMGLDTSSERTLWRDLALVELNVAVLHSFAQAGVTITDHHTESRRFLAHLQREEASGRACPADWTWIVPPLSGSARSPDEERGGANTSGPGRRPGPRGAEATVSASDRKS
jgi:nitric-oxide synthase